MAGPKLHVVLYKEELDPRRIEAHVVVVIDVLFATTTIATALARGAGRVIPALDEAEARALAREQPPGSYLLAGEKDAVILPGFAPPAPLALSRHGLTGKQLIYATTNGTVALRRAAGAGAVYAAALVNGAAVAGWIRRYHRHQTVLLLCAGSAGRFNLEDFYGAGHLAYHLTGGAAGEEGQAGVPGTGWELTDAARAALALYSGAPGGRSAGGAAARAEWGWACLAQSRVGRMMAALGHGDEVRHAARADLLPVVPRLAQNALWLTDAAAAG